MEHRKYIKDLLIPHPIWKDGNFWEQTLWQCAIEQVSGCGKKGEYREVVDIEILFSILFLWLYLYYDSDCAVYLVLYSV